MRCLYLDNFRGFADTIIPIRDVNFLVGENSTGKTSVLTMLQMMSAKALLFGTHAAAATHSSVTEMLPFAHHAEMVSAHSADRSYFRLGLANTTRRVKNEPSRFSGVLATFHDRDGMSFVSQITCTVRQRELAIRIEKKGVSYRVSEAPKVSGEEDVEAVLKQWVRQQAEQDGAEFTEIPAPKGVNAEQVQLLVILGVVAAQTTEEQKGQISDFFPDLWPEPVYLAPIRTKPLRTYSEPYMPFSPEGSHTPYLIRRMLNSAEEATKFRDFIDKIGSAGGLFQKIDIKYFGEASGAGPFEVDAYLDQQALNLSWVGYGVSQSLPILVELLFRPKQTWFAIQQPEVHLHPRAQASLGDAFFEMAHVDQKTLLVETHSDFAIDRFRMNYRAKRPARARSKLPISQVIFFERRDGHNTATPIPINDKGELSEDQPDGYRRFFLSEGLRLIGEE